MLRRANSLEEFLVASRASLNMDWTWDRVIVLSLAGWDLSRSAPWLLSAGALLLSAIVWETRETSWPGTFGVRNVCATRTASCR
jgi:hypothetical protein